MFEAIDPFESGLLPVSDDNEIYWETSGNPNGRPALYLHGGPGGGISGGYRRHFDPKKFLIVSFEQRGCGRSRPKITGPTANLLSNTTQALISDIEKLRSHLKIDSWLIYGASWGTTLALAYAQTYPEKVSAMILAAVTTTTSKEVEWVTEQVGSIFPIEWEKFKDAIELNPGERIIDAYYRNITSPEHERRLRTAQAWCAWEDVHVSLDPQFMPNPKYNDPEFCLMFATLVIHYWKHSAFLEEHNLLANIDRLSHLPCVLIHGRLDISSPLDTAWKIHKAWPGSELIITGEGHGGKNMFNEVTQAIVKLSDRG